MIRKSSEMPSLLLRIIADVETEVVEYKAAKQNYDFEDIGKYFSALSNEANLRNAECGWLFFGISNDRQIKGTAYRKESQMPSVGLRRLKHEIAQYTNNGMTFEEIYEFEVNGKRIVAFQIPAGSFATPTTWHGIPWSRENESLVEMPKFKLDAIYGQSRPDWSRQIAYEANLDDLDPDAVSFACTKFVEKFGGSQSAVRNLDEQSILSKMALVIHGHVSNAALVLLGKPESSVFLGGIEPRITWTLYASDPFAHIKNAPEFSEKSMGAFALPAKSSTNKEKALSQVVSCFANGLRMRRISLLNCNCIGGMETQFLAKPVFGVSPVRLGTLFQKSNNGLAKAAW